MSIYLFTKLSESEVKNQMEEDLARNSVALIQDVYTSKKGEIIPTVTMHYYRFLDRNALENRLEESLASVRYVYHKNQGWIQPTDENLEQYILQDSLLKPSEENLNELVKMLEGKGVESFYNNSRKPHLRANLEESPFGILLSGTLSKILNTSSFWDSKETSTIRNEIKKELSSLTSNDLQKFIDSTIKKISKLPGDNKFAKNVENILAKQFPAETEKAIKKLTQGEDSKLSTAFRKPQREKVEEKPKRKSNLENDPGVERKIRKGS